MPEEEEHLAIVLQAAQADISLQPDSAAITPAPFRAIHIP
jgi:hypothetical protein